MLSGKVRILYDVIDISWLNQAINRGSKFGGPYGTVFEPGGVR